MASASDKLDELCVRLLDFGKRNNMINFRNARGSYAEILSHTPDELLAKFARNATLEVFQPDPIEGAFERENVRAENGSVDPTSGGLSSDGFDWSYWQSSTNAPEELKDDKSGTAEPSDIIPKKGAKEKYLQRYQSQLKNKLLLYNSSGADGGDATSAIKNIAKKGKTHLEETGVNVVYLALGFVRWKDDKERENTYYEAPLLLAPISLRQNGSHASFTVSPFEDDVVVNPTFDQTLKLKFGVGLPDYDEDEGFEAYLQKVTSIVEQYGWSATRDCKIGLFSFLKIGMYRDLTDNRDRILRNPVVQALLNSTNEGSTLNANIVDATKETSGDERLNALHNVVDADSSQIQAIVAAKSGVSFVLQGPPGTGKSQTIANLIAECLHDGKKVLFVSEKLAALEVVYEKLKQAGLSEFCFELHSHKANKKEAISELCRTLQLEKSVVSHAADEVVGAKERSRRLLSEYVKELHKTRDVVDMSLYELYDEHSARRDVETVDCSIPNFEQKGKTFLANATDLFERFATFVPSIGYEYQKYPWFGFQANDLSLQVKKELQDDLKATTPVLKELADAVDLLVSEYGLKCPNVETASYWGKMFQYLSTSSFVTPKLLETATLTKVAKVLKELEEQSRELVDLRNKIDAEYEQEIYNIDGADCYKRLTKLFSGFFSRLFNKEYKELTRSLRLCRKSGKTPKYAEAVQVTSLLESWRATTERFEETERSIEGTLGKAYVGVDSDWDKLSQNAAALTTFTSRGYTFGKFAQLSDDEFERQRPKFAKLAQTLRGSKNGTNAANDFLTRYRRLKERFSTFSPNSSTREAYERFSVCLTRFDQLENWRQFYVLLKQIVDAKLKPFLDQAIEQNVAADQIARAFQKRYYAQWIDAILSDSTTLSLFSRAIQDSAVDAFAQQDKLLFDVNKAKIREKLSSTRPSLDLAIPGGAVSILLREGQKKSRQASVRKLLSETGELVQLLKPCFLMSPLSVSAYLDPESIHFDVVIFDEASQIFPQDAFGAIYRADQAIVVGDAKQMPPTNFFNANFEPQEGSDDEAFEAEDFESILDHCSTRMPTLSLLWHYRSRYEELIAFSNKNFYDSKLVTFPSPKADESDVGVNYYHVDGVFDRKKHVNRKEAEFVVDLIYRNLELHPERSLGVVAFSMAQQELIDDLLAERRRNEPDKERLFANDAKEPLFIKNLETAQGDERDVVIFSTAYARDAQGKLLQNFGPLNRVGGERRLNVAVTRAKVAVQLVSSLSYADVDLNRTKSEGARLLREYLYFAERGEFESTINERSSGDASSGTSNAFERDRSELETEVYDFLRSSGYEVDRKLGYSQSRLDLAVRRPGGSEHFLAIECDGATYRDARNTRDRDRLRREVLERMGWRYYRVWSTEWFRNRSVEQTKLLNAVRAALSTDSTSKELTSEPQKGTGLFEETASKEDQAFPKYKAANFEQAKAKFPYDFQKTIGAILETEAPLSEELLLRRLLPLFNKQKVTDAFVRDFNESMRGCETLGIVRRGGFLYLADVPTTVFRAPGDLTREPAQIAPEELAVGITELLKRNVKVERADLYRTLAKLCGFDRVGKGMNEAFDRALDTLGDVVKIDGDTIAYQGNFD